MLSIGSLKSNWDKIELYIISLWLLFLLIIIVSLDIPIYFGEDWRFIGIASLIKKNIIPIAALFFLILGFIFMGRFKYKLRGSVKTAIEIKEIENKNYEHLSFLSTYIIPLIAFDLSELKYAIVLFILLFAIGVIYIKTDLFYANPSLALLGYHIYKVDANFRTGLREGIILISREKLSKGQKVFYKKLTNNIYYVRSI